MKILYSFGLTGILILAVQLMAVTSSTTPPAGHTGAPGEATCNTSYCHASTLNAGGGSVSLVNPPASYVPGTKYTMQLQVADANRTRYGFQATALDASNAKQGNFSLTITANTNIQNQGNRQYVNHLNANSNNVWTFDWTAPATNVGPITFYLAGNAANNNGNNSGDNIYNATYVLQPATSTGILDAEAAFAVSVYPNPARGRLFVSGASLGQAASFRISDITGKLIRNMPAIPSAESLEINIADLTSGLYLFHFETKEGKQVIRKFVVE